MTPIFRKIDTQAKAGAEQVGHFDFKLFYPDVNRSTAWAEIEPYIRHAVRTYVIQYIGVAMWEKIAAELQQAVVDLSDTEQEFADLLRDTVAYYTMMVALPKKKNVVSSVGVVENAGQNVASSSQWGFRTTLWSIAQDADKTIDALLNFLEKQVAAGNTWFNEWKNDPAYNAAATTFFRSRAEFAQYHPLSSHRTYILLRSTIENVSRHYILPILCQEQFDALATAVRTKVITADQSTLLTYVQRVVAHRTIESAAKTIPALPDQEGFRIISNADAIDNRAYTAETTQSALAGMAQQSGETARTATADLIDYLYANPDKFPMWRDSSCNKTAEITSCGVYAQEYGGLIL